MVVSRETNKTWMENCHSFLLFVFVLAYLSVVLTCHLSFWAYYMSFYAYLFMRAVLNFHKFSIKSYDVIVIRREMKMLFFGVSMKIGC